jgi:FkbM family methyltransferase
MRTGLCRLLRIPQPGFVLRFYPSSLSAVLWIDPEDRRDDTDLLSNYLRAGDTVIDVGANIGNLALAAAVAVGPRGRVLAFEPHPRVFGYLSGNIALNHAVHVRAYNLALGDRRGATSLSDGRADDQNKVLPGGQGLPVPIERLDEVFDGQSDVSLLKIDVEGYEKYVLWGAEAVLSITACVYFEVSKKPPRSFWDFWKRGDSPSSRSRPAAGCVAWPATMWRPRSKTCSPSAPSTSSWREPAIQSGNHAPDSPLRQAGLTVRRASRTTPRDVRPASMGSVIRASAPVTVAVSNP